MDPKVAKADAKHQKIHSEKRKTDNSERKTGNEVFDKIICISRLQWYSNYLGCFSEY